MVDPPPTTLFGVSLRSMSLLVLALQNALVTILLHQSCDTKSGRGRFFPATAVLLTELIKGTVSFGFAVRSARQQQPPFLRGGKESGVVLELARLEKATTTVLEDISSDDSWKLALPAVLYLLQNQLQFVAAAHLDLPTFQVTYSFKVFSTALFSLAFRQRLSHRTWAAIIVLVAGVGVVHSSLLETPIAGAYRFKGLLAAYLGCCLSGLAGVSLESVLKQQPGTDLAIRNCQLSLFSLIPALLMALIPASSTFSSSRVVPATPRLPLFTNFGSAAISLCIMQAAGGILTGHIIRISGGNVSKGFATSLAFLLTFAVGALPVSFTITPKLLLGTLWIILASFLHGMRGDRRSSSRSRAPSLRHQAIYDPKVNSVHSMHPFPSPYAPTPPSPTRNTTPPPSSPRRATLCEPHSSPQTPMGFDPIFCEGYRRSSVTIHGMVRSTGSTPGSPPASPSESVASYASEDSWIPLSSPNMALDEADVRRMV